MSQPAAVSAGLMNFSQMSVSLSLLLSNRVPSWSTRLQTLMASEVYLRKSRAQEGGETATRPLLEPGLPMDERRFVRRCPSQKAGCRGSSPSAIDPYAEVRPVQAAVDTWLARRKVGQRTTSALNAAACRADVGIPAPRARRTKMQGASRQLPWASALNSSFNAHGSNA